VLCSNLWAANNFVLGNLGCHYPHWRQSELKRWNAANVTELEEERELKTNESWSLTYEQNHESLFSPVKCHHYCKLFSFFHERAEPQMWHWNAWLSIFNFGFFCLLSFKWRSTGWCLGFVLEFTRIFFLFVPHSLQYPIDFRSTPILLIILGVHSL
jgi:hypothetical protein